MAKIALMLGIGVLAAVTGGLAAAGYLAFGFAGGAGGLTGAFMGGEKETPKELCNALFMTGDSFNENRNS